MGLEVGDSKGRKLRSLERTSDSSVVSDEESTYTGHPPLPRVSGPRDLSSFLLPGGRGTDEVKDERRTRVGRVATRMGFRGRREGRRKSG